MRKELNNSGIIVDYDGDRQKIPNSRSFILELFTQNNYQCEILNQDGCKWTIELSNAILHYNKKYNIFLGNIRNEKRNEREKKIQLSHKDPRLIEKDIENVILGVYCYNSNDALKDLIISVWAIDPNKDYPSNPSLRGVTTDLLQQAKFKGFVSYQFVDAVVYCFRPEFIQYFLSNKDRLDSRNQELPIPFIPNSGYPYNLIYFGAPGTGKSHAISNYTNDSNSIKITFHPDTDYAAFVGSYKPVQLEDGVGITYSYVAQAFLKAYTKAWETEENTFLIIEEINRGNCAQIFGDIFQMIERKEDGYSKYKVDVDSEIEKYLRNHYEGLLSQGGNIAAKAERYMTYFQGKFEKIALPNNLFIHATMNTSDQSLFPIDSAFKRRWDWEYVPIDFDGNEANEYVIIIGEEKYSWRKFIEIVNDKIKIITDSEDKKLGQFFIKSQDKIISEKVLKAKVLFYIWSDILKDELQSGENYFFRKKDSDDDTIGTTFTFSDLFLGDSTSILMNFMKYLGVKAKEEDGEVEATAISEE